MISERKKRQVAKVALMFLKEKNLLKEKARFDVVLVMTSQTPPAVQIIKDAYACAAEYSY
jgi:Holliday junction resolvase-like predicted endonuclease